MSCDCDILGWAWGCPKCTAPEKTMALIDQLRAELAQAIPSLEMTLRVPRDPEGRWFLDIYQHDARITVEWKAALGFGVSATKAVFGEGPDEVFDTIAGAKRYVLMHLNAGVPAELPRRNRYGARPVRGITCKAGCASWDGAACNCR